MGALYHLKQKLVDFCNVIQENVSRTDTVPSSKVVYDLKADSDSQISDLNDSLTKNNIGTFIDITSQSTSPNKYTFPSDGYVFSSLSGSGNMYVTLYSASNDNQFYYGIASAGNNPFIVYVKKGMRIAINNTPSGVTPTIRFYQLI